MLKTRVITALVIFSITNVALFLFPGWAWGVFTFCVAFLACWEWGRFCRFSAFGSKAYLGLSLLFSALTFYAYHHGQLFGISFSQLAFSGFVIATAFWVFAAPIWLLKLWRPKASWFLGLVGWIVVFPTWLALLFLRDISPWLLLTFAAIVWVADTAAYFVGKRFGRNKLAPEISPGKTLEGAIGGIVGVGAYFFVWQSLMASSFIGNHVWAQELRSNLVVLFSFFVVLALLSVVGDLFESWMKRGAGMKDSSNLLPRHGGILDRIDALTSTLPVAGLYLLLLARA
ncbi:MAG: phosphatidate cytidylyltransferase [Burkholderiales bacterium]|nr:phosphatidate cytidylyltransferase [Burkholderiales bacterium]